MAFHLATPHSSMQVSQSHHQHMVWCSEAAAYDAVCCGRLLVNYLWLCAPRELVLCALALCVSTKG